MATPLKYLYSDDFYALFTDILSETIPNFEKEKYLKLIFDESWDKKELKERMRHNSIVLHRFLPSDFSKAKEFLFEIIHNIYKRKIDGLRLEFMFLPDYVEVYGIADLESSIVAIEFITQFTSCEFAVRPFILKYGSAMTEQMIAWSRHENHKVRRLASEGIRPRLPWAMALPKFKNDPSLVIELLENLKSDISDWVRLSVANNLNDISKDNPDIFLYTIKKWEGLGYQTDKIIKHASRTLLKAGHPEILKFYGFDDLGIELSLEKIHTQEVQIGGELEFSFCLKNENKNDKLIRIEYALYFKKLNGTHGRKVFKISEKNYKKNETKHIQRRHSFKLISTRKYHLGIHKIALIINGSEKKATEFLLTDA